MHENQDKQEIVVDESRLFEAAPIVPADEQTQEDITREIVGDVPEQQQQQVAPQANETFESYVLDQIKAVNPEYAFPVEIATGKKSDGTALTAKERHELLTAQIIENTDFGSNEEDAFIQQYLQAKAKGVDHNAFAIQYAQQANVLNMPSKNFVESYYKSMVNAEGTRQYSDEAINKLFETKSEIEIDQIANNLKRDYASKMQSNISKSMETTINEENKRYAPVITAYTDKLKSEPTIFGFELGEADKTEMATDIQKMFVRGRDGVNEFERLLSDDNFVMKLAPLVHLVKSGKYDSLISQLKESTKAKVLDNLDTEPDKNGGGVGSPQKVDENQLYD